MRIVIRDGKLESEMTEKEMLGMSMEEQEEMENKKDKTEKESRPPYSSDKQNKMSEELRKSTVNTYV